MSKFAKTGIFSGLNNLDDISLEGYYSDIYGYTQNELEMQFSANFENFDKNEVRVWYNGYSWTKEYLNVGRGKQKSEILQGCVKKNSAVTGRV